jgi:hypothetical protein
MKKTFVFSVSLLFISCLSWCQSVGIGTVSPDASAQLEISSTNKGLLIPRMSMAERNAIVTPAKGLMVYVSDDSSFYIHHNSWHRLTPADEVWNLKGNTGIASDHFIGTNDIVPVKFKVDGVLRMQLDHEGRLQLYNPGDNLFIGYEAGLFNTAGGLGNYFIGYQAGKNNTAGSQNYFTGFNTGYLNTTGSRNFFEGFAAGISNTLGSENHFSGFMAGFSSINSDYNHFVRLTSL